MANYRKKGEPPVGLRMARTWAIVHQSAWVLSSDLMEAPHGILSDYATWQSCHRAMERAGISLERVSYDENQFLYRLCPATVENLLGPEAPNE